MCGDDRCQMGIRMPRRRTLNRWGQFRGARRRRTFFEWFGRYFEIGSYVAIDFRRAFGRGREEAYLYIGESFEGIVRGL